MSIEWISNHLNINEEKVLDYTQQIKNPKTYY